MPITKTQALFTAYMLLASGTQAQQANTQAPPSQAEAAARLRAEQDQQRQQQQDARQRESMIHAPTVRSVRESLPEWPTLPHETPCFRIDAIELDTPEALPDSARTQGASLLPHDRFAFAQQWTDHYVGRCMGKQGVDAIVKGMQRVILSRGYVTTRVLLPEQDLSGGTLRIALIPGVIDQIRFADPGLYGTWKSAFPARGGDLLDLRDLEQGLEQMKRVSNQTVSMQIVPAQGPGSSDVVLDVARTKPWTLVASVDNTGTRATGKLQGSVSLGVYNPLGLNDVFNVGMTHDLSVRDKAFRSHGWNGSYTIPWGYWRATLAAYANRYYQQIAGVNQTFVASGNSQTADVSISRVLSRGQRHVSGAQIRLSRRFGQSFIEDIEIAHQRRNDAAIEVGFTHRQYWGTTQLDGLLAYRQGIGAFGARQDRLAANGGPTYRYRMALLDTTLSASFLAAGQPIRYVTTLHGQYTGNTLHYIDTLSIGGRYTVRGFDGETMLAAARGLYWRNEIQLPIGLTGHALYTGIDYGQVWGPQPVVLNGTRLVGTFVGVRGNVATRAGSYGYDVFAGTPVYKPAGFQTAKWTVGFQLTAQI
ncbi:Hemolysin transporter protein ShlB [Pandoraea captiosa]|uniref:Hemolysin transporter protein ShlB n=1 Tax=Pandoraea captiosa TaxID=2508302 RepID=A0A5E4ZS93_9BURK|nr:ShlB/FhaC/HecB family hemolysin secretion/activation protein [Pandoraea captiosa]VVE63302.1 Hemolysin transporter protein ShlB [Pandoraea captiosa]